MTGHDTLRQAIAARIKDLADSGVIDFVPLRQRIAIAGAVLADPTIRRWKNIADAVDNEPFIDVRHKPVSHAIFERLRAAGETT